MERKDDHECREGWMDGVQRRMTVSAEKDGWMSA